MIRDADTALAARMACDYQMLAATLPNLLAECAVAAESNDERALQAMVKACVASAFSVKPLGWIDLAARLAEHALAAAERLGDPVYVAAATFTRAGEVLTAGSRCRALAIAEDALVRLGDQSGGDGMSWAGMLHLHCAFTAAGLGLSQTVTAHLAEAAQLAEGNVGDGWRMEFTPTNVAVWRVAIALEDGEPDKAPEYARRVDLSRVRMPQRRAYLYMDTACGHFAAGRHDEAVRALLTADVIAAPEVRNRPTVREIVAQMVRDARQRGGNDELLALAVRCRVDPLHPDL